MMCWEPSHGLRTGFARFLASQGRLREHWVLHAVGRGFKSHLYLLEVHRTFVWAMESDPRLVTSPDHVPATWLWATHCPAHFRVLTSLMKFRMVLTLLDCGEH